MAATLRRVVIGGGTGYVGSSVGKALRERGVETLVVSRTAGPGRMTWTDLAKDGLPECDAVINVSGENVLNFLKRWTPAFQTEVRESRVDRTRQLAEVIAKAKTPPKVFISTSGVGFYKPSETAVYTDESPGGDFDFMSKLCTDWEAGARLPAGTPTRQVVMRLGVVLGRGAGAYPQMRFPFLFGVGGVTGSGKQFFPWIHEQDVAGLFVHALTSSTVTGPMNAVAPDAVTNSQFCSTLASVMGRPNLLWVPGFVFNALLGLDRAVMLLEGQNVVPKKAVDTGYVFKYPTLKEAITELEE